MKRTLLPPLLLAVAALALACGLLDAPPSPVDPAPAAPSGSPPLTTTPPSPPSSGAAVSAPFELQAALASQEPPGEDPPLRCPDGAVLEPGPWLVPSFAVEPTAGATPSELAPALPARSEGDRSWWCARGGVGDGPALQTEDSDTYTLQVRGTYVAGKPDGVWTAQWELGEDYWSNAFALEFSQGQAHGDWVLFCSAPNCEGEITRQRYAAGLRDGTWVWGGGRTSVSYVAGTQAGP